MLSATQKYFASLRYQRPYWMMFLGDVDNWKIYTVIHQPDHYRTETLYQAWLGGLDRPYARPKCMAHQPVWLTKKRHSLRKPRLDNAETPLERYVLEWHKKFLSFDGSARPTVEDLHTAFDLVERPLDLSYATQLLHRCRNINNMVFEEDSFVIFLEACLRVDRKDVALYAMENHTVLGFPVVTEDCRKYLLGEQSWYKRSVVDGLYYPIEENADKNGPQAAPQSGVSEDDELTRLQAELDALEKGQ
jgi:hypothetical protein